MWTALYRFGVYGVWFLLVARLAAKPDVPEYAPDTAELLEISSLRRHIIELLISGRRLAVIDVSVFPDAKEDKRLEVCQMSFRCGFELSQQRLDCSGHGHVVFDRVKGIVKLNFGIKAGLEKIRISGHKRHDTLRLNMTSDAGMNYGLSLPDGRAAGSRVIQQFLEHIPKKPDREIRVIQVGSLTLRTAPGGNSLDEYPLDYPGVDRLWEQYRG